METGYPTAVVLLAILAIMLLVLSIYLVFALLKAVKRRDRVATRFSMRYERILSSLDTIFKYRTGLSKGLMNLVLGENNKSEYEQESQNFLVRAVDELQTLLSEYTGGKCSVSIKLLRSEIDTGKPLVETLCRDSESAFLRNASYKDYEPFSIDEHSYISEIIHREPFDQFKACNNIKKTDKKYKNPSLNWHSMFNASAIYAVCDPDLRNNDAVYGFLCVDNNIGNLDNDSVRHIMSIVSTGVFFVLSALAVLSETEHENAGETVEPKE